MGHALMELLVENLASGLNRKTINSCSKWAQAYRVMGQPFPGKWKFDYHPWARAMCDAKDEMVVGQKAAQMAYTEVALNKVFYAIDVHGISVLYILPATSPDASDFSTARFDPALEMSDHLNNMFSDVKNIGHKRAGNANLYIRGSRSRSQLKSLPVGLIVFDEVDEMVQDNIPLAFERMSGQLDKQSFLISTPTIDNYGINAYFRQSTQDHYYFKCPHCSKYTELLFPECLVITAESHMDINVRRSYIKCKECDNRLDHETKKEWLGYSNAKWISSYTDRVVRGFHINQLYSSTVKPYELATSYLKAATNPADEQEFYNSKLGLTHIVEGARVTEKQLDECIGGYIKSVDGIPNSVITLGVDVGKWLHYEVDQWFFKDNLQTNDINLMATCRIIAEGKVLNFEELDGLMRNYGVMFCVIDANPEKRKALEFAQRFWGHVRLCYYGNNLRNSKQIHLHSEEDHTMTVDRTSWLDLSLGRFKQGFDFIQLPKDVSQEYRKHMKSLVRIYEKDTNGNPVGRYVRGNDDDHFAHARNYAELALPLGMSLAKSYDIGNIV